MSEEPKAQLARDIGMHVGQLRTWRLEFEKKALMGIVKPDRTPAEDLEQLRRENAKLWQVGAKPTIRRPGTSYGSRARTSQ